MFFLSPLKACFLYFFGLRYRRHSPCCDSGSNNPPLGFTQQPLGEHIKLLGNPLSAAITSSSTECHHYSPLPQPTLVPSLYIPQPIQFSSDSMCFIGMGNLASLCHQGVTVQKKQLKKRNRYVSTFSLSPSIFLSYQIMGDYLLSSPDKRSSIH